MDYHEILYRHECSPWDIIFVIPWLFISGQSFTLCNSLVYNQTQEKLITFSWAVFSANFKVLACQKKKLTETKTWCGCGHWPLIRRFDHRLSPVNMSISLRTRYWTPKAVPLLYMCLCVCAQPTIHVIAHLHRLVLYSLWMRFQPRTGPCVHWICTR